MKVHCRNHLCIIDRAAERIPVISSLTSLIDLFIKYTALPCLKNTKVSKTHFYKHLNTKSPIRCLILMVPILGNIAIAFYDNYKTKKIEKLMKLANNYEKGSDGQTKNEGKAVECYKKAAYLGNMIALNNLGIIYLNGECGVQKDNTKALHFLKKATDQKDANSKTYLNLAKCYEDTGKQADMKKALECYRQAADLGNPEGIFQVGHCYENGIGVKKNLAKAFEFYEKAANKGHTGALNSLATFYDEGIIVQEDPKKAFELFKAASEKKDADGIILFNLAECYLNGDGTDVNEKEGVELMERAANMGDVDAMLKIARIYSKGKYGVEENTEKATLFYQMAADRGNQKAIDSLEKLKKGVDQPAPDADVAA